MCLRNKQNQHDDWKVFSYWAKWMQPKTAINESEYQGIGHDYRYLGDTAPFHLAFY